MRSPSLPAALAILACVAALAGCGGGAVVDDAAGLAAPPAAPAPPPAVPSSEGAAATPPREDDAPGEAPGSGEGAPGASAGVTTPCAPHSQGYWHHVCQEIASPVGLAGRTTHGNGNGSGHGNGNGNGNGGAGGDGRGPGGGRDASSEELALFASTDAIVLAVDAGQGNTCGALDADPPSDGCERAMKQLAAFLLNVASGLVAADAWMTLPDGTVVSAQAASDLLEAARLAGDCATVEATASHLNGASACAAAPPSSGSEGGDSASSSAERTGG